MLHKNRKINILLIEDEDFDVKRVENTIEPYKDTIVIKKITSEGNEAVEILKNAPDDYDVVIMDYQIAGNLTGESLISKIKSINPYIQIIVITKMTINVTDFEFAQKLMNAGAMWFCTKYPGDIEEYIYQPTDFILSIMNAYEKKRLALKEKASRGKLERNVQKILEEKNIIGKSESMRNLKLQILQVAKTDASIVIQGESGTGKELVATHIHYLSDRKLENFVAINCGSIPKDLIESELFGYEKGAFTGASERKPGLFELAHKGTVFLDEIGELPPDAQVKLLRVLQEGEIDKIGRRGRVKVDVRVIAATNKNLEEEVRKGNFREDLYYRINVFSLMIPPLRDRTEDIPEILHYYLNKYSVEMNSMVPVISPDAMKILLEYPWPGNVRELQNVSQRLLLMRKREIEAEDAEFALGKKIIVEKQSSFSLSSVLNGDIIPLKELENRVRKEYIQYVRKKYPSDAETARALGLAPPNYYRLCKKLGIK